MDKIARIILFICKEHDIDLKSDSNGKIALVRGEEEYCINDIAEDHQVNIFKESQPDGLDYTIIEQV